jgi:hypothetical protein
VTVTLAGCSEYLADVSQALATYSEERRDKRSARAKENEYAPPPNQFCRSERSLPGRHEHDYDAVVSCLMGLGRYF